MNQKRWLALVLAIAIFIFSFVSMDTFKSIVSAIQGDKEATTKILDHFKGQEGALTEEIIQKGDSQKRIVVLNIDGTITNDSQSVTNGYQHDTFLAELQSIQKDQTIRGILLVLNSPGGGAYESDQIRERLIEIQQTLDIPVYVSMKSIATGGSYYIAMSGTKLFASNETITGFIRASIKTISNPNKEVLQKMTNDSYNRFIDVVSKSRGIPKDKMEPLAGGRIFDGKKAKELGLIDEIGNEQDTMIALKNDYQLEDAEIFVYLKSDSNMYEIVADKIGGVLQRKEKNEQQSDFDSSPRMMYLYGGE